MRRYASMRRLRAIVKIQAAAPAVPRAARWWRGHDACLGCAILAIRGCARPGQATSARPVSRALMSSGWLVNSRAVSSMPAGSPPTASLASPVEEAPCRPSVEAVVELKRVGQAGSVAAGPRRHPCGPNMWATGGICEIRSGTRLGLTVRPCRAFSAPPVNRARLKIVVLGAPAGRLATPRGLGRHAHVCASRL